MRFERVVRGRSSKMTCQQARKQLLEMEIRIYESRRTLMGSDPGKRWMSVLLGEDEETHNPKSSSVSTF